MEIGDDYYASIRNRPASRNQTQHRAQRAGRAARLVREGAIRDRILRINKFIMYIRVWELSQSPPFHEPVAFWRSFAATHYNTRRFDGLYREAKAYFNWYHSPYRVPEVPPFGNRVVVRRNRDRD